MRVRVRGVGVSVNVGASRQAPRAEATAQPAQAKPVAHDGPVTTERKDRRGLMSPAWVESVKPEATPVEWRDTKQPGLVLRVEVSGRKTWIARYWFNGRDRRFKIGVYDATTLSAARTSAKGKIGLAENGPLPPIVGARRLS